MRCESVRKKLRLSMRRAPGLLELPLQPLVVTPQPVAFTFHTLQLSPQLIAFTLGAFDTLAHILGVWRFAIVAGRRRLRHIDVSQKPENGTSTKFWMGFVTGRTR